VEESEINRMGFMKLKFCIKQTIIFLPLLIILLSCNSGSNPVDNDDNKPGSGNISVGTTVSVITQDVNPAGGTVKVVSSGSPINGLEITVPVNSYSDSRSFNISYAPIQSHTFGANFNPISPMIMIKNGGGYAADMMTIKVPIKKAADEFAMGFMYNESTGRLEGLPILALSDSSVTIGTRHFAASAGTVGKSLFKTQDAVSVGNVIIASIKESLLSGQNVISTGFKPGVDDWEFVNYGSYVAPGGHCAGQSISAMWYYYEKKLSGATKLYHTFDKYFVQGTNGDVLWMDNVNGYRFASMVQKNIDWDGTLYNIFEKVEQTKAHQYLSWKAFALSMLVTGEPQFVGLTSNKGGHAIIAHKISLSENKLYVTDPNYPGQERTISFNGTSFDAYSTKQNQDEINTNSYWGVGYYSKTCMIDWDKIASLYSEFTKGTVGSSNFPSYDLLVKGTTPTALTDNMVIYSDTLKVYCRSTAAAEWLTSTDHLQGVAVYDNTGKFLGEQAGSGSNKGIAEIPLKAGKNLLGFYVRCGNNGKLRYVDFKWITVNANILSITSISPTSGEAGTTLTIKGTAFKPTQGNSYVEFNGLATTSVSSWNDTLITLRVPQNASTGDVTVVVDGKRSNGIKFTSTTPISLNGLDQTTKVQVVIDGETILGTQTNITSVSIANTDGFASVGYTAYSECKMTWSGTTFKIKGVHVRSTYQRDSVYISGVVSADGKTILSVDAAYRYYSLSSSDGSIEDEESYSFTFTNIPLYVSYNGTFSFLTMSSPASKISNFKWRRWSKSFGEESGTFTSVLIVHVDFE
jgi:hypothetical protein